MQMGNNNQIGLETKSAVPKTKSSAFETKQHVLFEQKRKVMNISVSCPENKSKENLVNWARMLLTSIDSKYATNQNSDIRAYHRGGAIESDYHVHIGHFGGVSLNMYLQVWGNVVTISSQVHVVVFAKTYVPSKIQNTPAVAFTSMQEFEQIMQHLCMTQANALIEFGHAESVAKSSCPWISAVAGMAKEDCEKCARESMDKLMADQCKSVWSNY
jgi:hypothetical protein